jgi:chromosome segregation ATPase
MYNSMLQERLTAEEEVRSSLERELANVKAEADRQLKEKLKRCIAEEQQKALIALEDLRQKHDAAVSRLDSELKDSRDEVSQLRESEMVLRRQMQDGERRFAELEKTMVKLQAVLKDTDDKLVKSEQSKQALSNEMNQKLKLVSQERDDAVALSETTSKRLQHVTETAQQLERDLASAAKELDALRKRFSDNSSSLQQELQARDSTISEMKRAHESSIKAKDAEIAQLKENTAKLQAQLNMVLAEAQTLRKERDEAKADALAARKEGATSADELSKRLNKVSARAVALQPTVLIFFKALSDSQAEVARLKEAHAKELDALNAKFRGEAAAADKETKAKIAELESKHSKEKQTSDEVYKKQLADLRDALEGNMSTQIKNMQSELDALRKKAAADIDALKSAHLLESDAASKKTAEALSAAQTRHSQNMEEVLSKAAAAEKRLRSEIERLSSDSQLSMQALIQEKKKLEADLTSASSAAAAQKSEIAALKQQLSLLQADLAKVTKERDDISAKLSAVGADAQSHGARSRQLEAEVAALKEKIARMSSDHESVVASLKAACDGLLMDAAAERRQLEATLAEVRASFEEDRKRVNNEHTAALRQLQESCDCRMSAAKAAFESELQKSLAIMDSKRQAQLAAEEERGRAAVAAVRKEAADDASKAAAAAKQILEKERSESAANLASRLAILRDEHASATAAVAAAHKLSLEQLQSQMQSRCDSLQSMIEHEKKEVQAGRDREREMARVAEGLRAEMDAAGRAHTQKCSRMEEEWHSKEAAAAEDHQRQLRALSAQHDQVLRQHQEAAEAARATLEDVCCGLRDELAEMARKYHARESLPEDLERIMQLQQAVMEREQALEKAVADMKFYKLELVNREENFNNRFSQGGGTGAMNVGVMNPLAKKGAAASGKPPSSGSVGSVPGLQLGATGARAASGGAAKR